MTTNTRRARALFGAALALYAVWIGALIALAAVSGARPGERTTRHAPTPVNGPAGPDAPKQ